MFHQILRLMDFDENSDAFAPACPVAKNDSRLGSNQVCVPSLNCFFLLFIYCLQRYSAEQN